MLLAGLVIDGHDDRVPGLIAPAGHLVPDVGVDVIHLRQPPEITGGLHHGQSHCQDQKAVKEPFNNVSLSISALLISILFYGNTMVDNRPLP